MYFKAWHQVMTKYDKYYNLQQVLQSVTDISKCDSKFWQNVTDITVCDRYYKVWQNIITKCDNY